MAKYRMTDDVIVTCERVLHRIEALVDIQRFGVKAGDLGGYIEREENLSHDGNAWIGGDAQVYGDAWVCGYAQIRRNGKIESIKDYCVFGPCGSRDDFTTFYKTETGI